MFSSSTTTSSRLARTTAFPTIRILVVEDDEDMRQVLVEGLEADGHEVRGCARVDDALQTLEGDGPFDVLITDVRLPGASGLELLSVLHQRRGMPARIVITGFGNQDLHECAAALGAFAVFDKPFDVDDLRTAVINSKSAA